MDKEIINTLAEKLLAIGPIIHKKIVHLDMQYDNVLPLNQLMVLGLVHEFKSLSISEICKKLSISKPQMTIIIDKLVKNNFVLRVSNSNDRRTININLTEKGDKYCKDLLNTLRKNLSCKLATLSEEDLKTLLNSVKITESILNRLE